MEKKGEKKEEPPAEAPKEEAKEEKKDEKKKHHSSHGKSKEKTPDKKEKTPTKDKKKCKLCITHKKQPVQCFVNISLSQCVCVFFNVLHSIYVILSSGFFLHTTAKMKLKINAHTDSSYIYTFIHTILTIAHTQICTTQVNNDLQCFFQFKNNNKNIEFFFITL